MERIASKDGTLLDCRVTGDGPPLLLIHGTASSALRWASVLPALERCFRVHALDRRGRGESTDAPRYALEREVEDVAAVVGAIGGPVHVLGHSYGGLCALEAALQTPNVARLILYEAPIPVAGVPSYETALIDRMEALLAAGQREQVVLTFMHEILHRPSDAIESVRSSPSWPGRVAAAHTIPRELRALAAYRFEPERFRRMAAPTLLLLGGESPSFFKATFDALAAALPDRRAVVLPGQGHAAMDTAPGLFVNEVTSFLQSSA